MKWDLQLRSTNNFMGLREQVEQPYTLAQHGSAWLSMAQHGSAWLSMAQHGSAWLSMTHGFAQPSNRAASAYRAWACAASGAGHLWLLSCRGAKILVNQPIIWWFVGFFRGTPPTFDCFFGWLIRRVFRHSNSHWSFGEKLLPQFQTLPLYATWASAMAVQWPQNCGAKLADTWQMPTAVCSFCCFPLNWSQSKKSMLHLTIKIVVLMGPLFAAFHWPKKHSQLSCHRVVWKPRMIRGTLLRGLPTVLDSPHRHSKPRGQHRLVQRLRTCSGLVDSSVGCKTGCTTHFSHQPTDQASKQPSNQPTTASFMTHISIGARIWGTWTSHNSHPLQYCSIQDSNHSMASVEGKIYRKTSCLMWVKH